MSNYRHLPRDTNQVRGLAEYALDFIHSDEDRVAAEVYRRLQWFHVDSVACAIAALKIDANAPHVLRREALQFPLPGGARCFGSRQPVVVEKAIVANCSAVRELDSNGTNFGHNPRTGDVRGEFGHNDFYPVAVAGGQAAGLSGPATLRAMLCLDEIRGRLAEVFGLKDHKIDHVLHGAIASAVVLAACLKSSVDQIESAVGLLVAHYVPFRAIRAGHQLSDSKGASAAISAEMAALAVRRARAGFVGPADIFRNPQAVFCLFEPPDAPDCSPFDLELAEAGDDFAVMGMHFKLGLYEHQSAGALQGVLQILEQNPSLLQQLDGITRIRITIYEPAFSIIGDPAKRDPRTRQSADHSMLYIVATLLRKAGQRQRAGWKELMLLPEDYDQPSLHDPITRRWMERIDFVHGGAEYDARYPDGIPTTVEIEHSELGTLSSGLVMYPQGHARHEGDGLEQLLEAKWEKLIEGTEIGVKPLRERLERLERGTVSELQEIYSFALPPCSAG